MSISEQIGYELEIEENASISDLQDRFQDGLCIWISGSGGSGDMPAKYRIAIEYRKHIQYMESECPGKTANQAMIIGATDAIARITRPIRVYIISAATLGFESGLKGKGTNAKYIQDLFVAVMSRNCSLTEVRFVNGTDVIKRHICGTDPSGKADKDLKNRQLRYKEIIYRECIDKATKILKDCGVAEGVISRIKELHPSE